MRTYEVIWRIAIEAQSYRDAADQAREIQLDPDSEALFFDLKNLSTGREVVVDLMDLEDNPQDPPLEQLAAEAE